jgi:hypothetical protein
MANIFLIAMALIVAVWPFFGRSKPHAEHAHEVALPMRRTAAARRCVGLFVGL